MMLIHLLFKLVKFIDDTTTTFINEKHKKLISFLNEDNTDFFKELLPNNNLVVVNHRGSNFVAMVCEYELDVGLMGNICYITENKSHCAVILTNKNCKKKLGNSVEYVLKNENKILEIARITKEKSILAILNVYYELEKNYKLEVMCEKSVRAAHKNHKSHILLMENSWIS